MPKLASLILPFALGLIGITVAMYFRPYGFLDEPIPYYKTLVGRANNAQPGDVASWQQDDPKAIAFERRKYEEYMAAQRLLVNGSVADQTQAAPAVAAASEDHD